MLNEFITYLNTKRDFSKTTIVTYTRVIHKFLLWCNQKGYETEQMSYRQCRDYINVLKSKTTSSGKKLRGKSIAMDVGVIKLYFDCLVEEEYRNLNPLHEKKYKNKDKFFHEQLTQDELYDLYVSYPTLYIKPPKCKSVAIRNKVITGLAVFQALNATTLQALEVNHINLKQGYILVPGTRSSNPRKLKLNPIQIVDLREYIDIDRAILQDKIKCFTEALFPLNSHRFSVITSQVTKKLKTINYKVTNLLQIHNSVISIWVKQYDLRTAQVMAGHRYASSTEKYKKTDIEALQSAAAKYHPRG